LSPSRAVRWRLSERHWRILVAHVPVIGAEMRAHRPCVIPAAGARGGRLISHLQRGNMIAEPDVVYWPGLLRFLRAGGRIMLTFGFPGGEALDRLVGPRMEVGKLISGWNGEELDLACP
jgi:hypothetical protein